jgi:hypothetical protein
VGEFEAAGTLRGTRHGAAETLRKCLGVARDWLFEAMRGPGFRAPAVAEAQVEAPAQQNTLEAGSAKSRLECDVVSDSGMGLLSTKARLECETRAGLDALGFVRDAPACRQEAWAEGYAMLTARKAAHGDWPGGLVPMVAAVPGGSVGPDGGWPGGFETADGHVGSCVALRRPNRSGVTSAQGRLEALRFVTDPRHAALDDAFGKLFASQASNGDCRAPPVNAEGHSLAACVQGRRQEPGASTYERRLEEAGSRSSVGCVHDSRGAAEGYAQLAAYIASHGDCRVPVAFVAADGYALGAWFLSERQRLKVQRRGSAEAQTSRLEALGLA